MASVLFLFLNPHHQRICSLLRRGGGGGKRERESEGERYQCEKETLLCCLPYVPGICLDWELNPQPSSAQDNTPTNWVTWPELTSGSLFTINPLHIYHQHAFSAWWRLLIYSHCLYYIRLFIFRLPPKPLHYPVPAYCFSFTSYHSLHVQSFAAHALNHTTTFPSDFKMVF